MVVEIWDQDEGRRSAGRAKRTRRVKRRHAAVCSKVAPGQPPFRPAAVVNLLAIIFWATFVLWPLATWVLDLA